MTQKVARTILVTGAARGIGAATVKWLAARGHRTIGADLDNAEIEADLATPDGRARLRDEARHLAPDGLDAVVAIAGISSLPDAPPQPALMVRVNYFGALATLEGLRPLLSGSRYPQAVAILSTAALCEPDTALVAAMLAGDEEYAVELAEPLGPMAYHQTKLALGLWMRRTAVSREWAGRGIALNGVGPGQTRTRMTIPLIEYPEMKKMLDEVTPYATPAMGEPDDLAAVIGAIATLETTYMVGQAIFVDGGTDAIQRTGLL